MADLHKWLIHGGRLVNDTPHIRVSLADVELPDHVRFTQYVFRMRRCAMTVVLDDAGERVLLMRRHRFIVDRRVWELPGGYVDDGEDPAAADAPVLDGDAARAGRGADQPVLQVAAVRQFDVGEADVEPLVFVEGLLAVHGPAHAGQYSSLVTWRADGHQ